MDVHVRDAILALARAGRAGLTQSDMERGIAEAPAPMVDHALGYSAPAESEVKALERALVLWELLLLLGFTREHATLALERAPNLELEECVAWLLTVLDYDEYRTLTWHVESPQDAGLARASALDPTVPPAMDMYEHSRTDKAAAPPPPPKEAETTSQAELDAATLAALKERAQRLLEHHTALLDSDAAELDVIEHPTEAWATARVIHQQIDQIRAQRRKALGGAPTPAQAEALDHDTHERRWTQLVGRAQDMVQQSEMQPAFHKAAAMQRFRERMREHDEQEREHARAAQREAEARRKRQDDLARLSGEAPAHSGADGADSAPAPNASEAPADSTREDGADDGAASEAGSDTAPLDGVFDLLEAPADVAGAPTTSVRLREMATQGGARTPRALLSDAVALLDPHALIKYTPLTGSGIHRSQLEVTWSAKPPRPMTIDTFRLCTEGCATKALADDLVATIALNCFGRERQVQRLLAPGFRQVWDELEAARQAEREAFLRDVVGHVQRALERRDVGAPARARRTRPEEPETGAGAAPQRGAREPVPSLAAEWQARTASPAYAAMRPAREDLPIFQARQSILDSVAQSQVVVLSGETGCGKSTQLPAYLLEDCLERGEPCKIYVTEPRRISAISLAERVSQELGEARGAVGSAESLVGYAIRLESQVGPKARLVYATTGIVLRMLESSVLQDVTHIIVDEVHERSIESDFLLIVLKSLRTQRPDLKIVLMSATLDAQRLSEYFDQCPALAVPGRTFPVDSYFLEDVLETCDYTLDPESPYARRDDKTNQVDLIAADSASESDAEDQTGTALDTQRYRAKTLETLTRLNEHVINYELLTLLLCQICTLPAYEPFSHAILVFLPGMGEIRECLRHMSEHRLFQSQCVTHILHSSVASEDQSAAFAPPPPGQRKIVLATNIAETGITIPDITCVIDSGRHREMRYDEKRKISRLVECFVAQSNAKQRRGRAGRVQHGLCFHLFTRKRFEMYFDPHPLPEMLRLSLQELALQLKVMPLQIGASIEDALLQALDPPQAVNIQRAVASLVEVEALKPNEDITPLGRHLCHMPLDVHLAKFLLIAVLFRCTDTALSIAAVLNVKSPFLTSMGREAGRGRGAFQQHDSDFLTLAAMFRAWRAAVERHQGAAFCSAHSLQADVLYQMEELRQQYFAYLVDTNFVHVDKSVRDDLARRRRPRNGRPRLMTIPAHLDTHSQNAPVVTLALVAAMYPKLLVVDEKSQAMRTLTNNQPAAVHPSSVNARKSLGSAGSHYVLYHSIVMSRRLYAWNTATVDDRMVALVAGDADFRHTARSIYLDHNRVRMATYDAASLVALRYLRDQLRRLMHASYQAPGTPWTPAQESIFSLTLQLLGVPASESAA